MRSAHDAPRNAATGVPGNSVRRLERLSRLRDYDVEAHEPDPRGWPVVSRDGHTVGEVKDLIVDTERMVATMLDVELDTKLFDLRDDDPHVLVPVERVQRTGKHLVVDDINASWVSALCAAREAHHREFWDRWWHREGPRGQAEGTRITRRGVSHDELRRVVDGLKPGETVRIPVVNEVPVVHEEIVVERRPVATSHVTHDEHVVNRAADEPPSPRR